MLTPDAALIDAGRLWFNMLCVGLCAACIGTFRRVHEMLNHYAFDGGAPNDSFTLVTGSPYRAAAPTPGAD